MARAGTSRQDRPEAEWAKVRAAYIAGEGSMADMAARFRVPLKTLKKRASRESWNLKRGQVGARTDEKVIEQTSTLRARLATLRWGVGERIANAAKAALDQVDLTDPDGLASLARALNTAIPADSVGLPDEDGASPLEGVEIIIRRKQPAGA